ncbi:MAG: hypothetical protein JNM17_17655 [Archangium sp.]|nr:hypothetical protein [Archangium sp.]
MSEVNESVGALLLAALVLLGGCSKCGSASAVDAGTDAGTIRKLGTPKHSIDLRTAIVWIYPEYRGTAVLETTATLTRTMPKLTDAERDEALNALHWEPAQDGGWWFSTFHLSQPDPHTLSVIVSYTVDQLGHLYINPTGLNSQELALYLPRGAEVSAERFTLDVRYTSSPDRSRELIRQAVTLLLGNGQWKALTALEEWTDAMPPSPSESIRLAGPDGAVITFERTGGKVFTQYALDTR